MKREKSDGDRGEEKRKVPGFDRSHHVGDFSLAGDHRDKQRERAHTHPQSAGQEKRGTRTYIRRQRRQDQSDCSGTTWRTFETAGKELFHDQVVG